MFELHDPCPKEYLQCTDDYGYTVYDVVMELPEHERFIKRSKIYSGSVAESWTGNVKIQYQQSLWPSSLVELVVFIKIQNITKRFKTDH